MESAEMSKIEFHPGWPYSSSTYGCKTHWLDCIQGTEVRRRWNEKEKHNWFLDCGGNHSGFYRIPISFEASCKDFPTGPRVNRNKIWPRVPPSQSMDTGRPWLWNLLSAGPSECKVACRQVLFPTALGLLTTHIIRLHFSDAFVQP